MSHSTHTISALRQRRIEDVRVRILTPSTQTGYNRAVKRFATYLKRS